MGGQGGLPEMTPLPVQRTPTSRQASMMAALTSFSVRPVGSPQHSASSTVLTRKMHVSDGSRGSLSCAAVSACLWGGWGGRRVSAGGC